MEIQLHNAEESPVSFYKNDHQDVTSAIQYTQTAQKLKLAPRWEPAGNSQLIQSCRRKNNCNEL